MSFFVTAPLSFVLLLLFMFSELSFRKRVGAEPANLKTLWMWAQKKQAPHPKYPAFFFMVTAIYFFQVWEAFLKYLLQSEGSLWLSSVGFLLSLLILFLRRNEQLKHTEPYSLGRFGVVGFFVGLALFMNSFGTLICLPWLYWRSSFFPARL